MFTVKILLYILGLNLTMNCLLGLFLWLYVLRYSSATLAICDLGLISCPITLFNPVNCFVTSLFDALKQCAILFFGCRSKLWYYISLWDTSNNGPFGALVTKDVVYVCAAETHISKPTNQNKTWNANPVQPDKYHFFNLVKMLRDQFNLRSI